MSSSSAGCRVVMYSHDAMGMGHVRRNLLVAQALADACGPEQATLLISGVAEAALFEPSRGVDFLTLPSLSKVENGSYCSRRLPLPARGVLAVRGAAILGAVTEFDPDVLIVDKLPRGAGHELDQTLAYLRYRGRTRCVLALRDVLDEPQVVREEWRRDGSEDVIRSSYDAVWVYGSPVVYDPVREYGMAPDVAAKVRYTGYLDRRVKTPNSEPEGRALDYPGARSTERLPDGPFVLCMVGGGEDGAFLADAFADAPLRAGMSGVLVTGPFMPAAARERLLRKAAARPPGDGPMHICRFVDRPHELIGSAERVIAMGGYNTVWEILSYGKRCLLAPRVAPRREQWIRAERLAALGLVDVIHPDAVSPDALAAWLARELPPPCPVSDAVDMDGLRRLPALLRELLNGPAATHAQPVVDEAEPRLKFTIGPSLRAPLADAHALDEQQRQDVTGAHA
jgi:predicted glycosyltransferase